MLIYSCICCPFSALSVTLFLLITFTSSTYFLVGLELIDAVKHFVVGGGGLLGDVCCYPALLPLHFAADLLESRCELLHILFDLTL